MLKTVSMCCLDCFKQKKKKTPRFKGETEIRKRNFNTQQDQGQNLVWALKDDSVQVQQTCFLVVPWQLKHLPRREYQKLLVAYSVSTLLFVSNRVLLLFELAMCPGEREHFSAQFAFRCGQCDAGGQTWVRLQETSLRRPK